MRQYEKALALHRKACASARADCASGNVLNCDPKSWGDMIASPSYSGKRVTAKTLLEYTASFSAIRYISETGATLPLKIYKTSDEGASEDKAHAINRLLNWQPNSYQTPVDLIEAIFVSLCCYGQAYVLASRVNGRVADLKVIPYGAVGYRVDLDRNDVIYSVSRHAGDYYSSGSAYRTELRRGGPINSDDEFIIPIKGFGGDIEGVKPFDVAKHALGLGMAAEEYGSNYFKNGAKLGGWIEYDKKLNKDQRDAFREEFNRLHEGSENAFKLGLLESGFKYVQSQQNISDADMIKLKEEVVADVARVWRVPLHQLMLMGGAKYNSIEQTNMSFLQTGLAPYLDRIQQAFNTCLLGYREKRFFRFDDRELLRGDSASRAAYYAAMRNMGGMTQNEIRQNEGLNKHPDPVADQLNAPLNSNAAPAGPSASKPNTSESDSDGNDSSSA